MKSGTAIETALIGAPIKFVQNRNRWLSRGSAKPINRKRGVGERAGELKRGRRNNRNALRRVARNHAFDIPIRL